MSGLQFEWDPEKARTNRRTYGVMFEEAATVFDDPKLLREYDSEHSADEDREIVIGYSARLRILVVVATERHDAIRIISVRKANAYEAQRYAAQD